MFALIVCLLLRADMGMLAALVRLACLLLSSLAIVDAAALLSSEGLMLVISEIYDGASSCSSPSPVARSQIAGNSSATLLDLEKSSQPASFHPVLRADAATTSGVLGAVPGGLKTGGACSVFATATSVLG